MAIRDEMFAKNAVEEVSVLFDIPKSKLFVQWFFRMGPENFKALIKHGGTDIFYEVTCPNENSGYEINVYEKVGGAHDGGIRSRM